MVSRIRLISLLVSIVVILSISPEAGSQRLGYYCRNNIYNPNVNTTYRANLNILLSTLSDASRTEDFQKSAAGLNTSEPTFGLYMCRGDVTGDICHSCMENASTDILKNCPDQKVAIIWYDNCMIRYSNQFITSLRDRGIILTMFNINNVTAGELDGFNQTLNKMMDEVVTEAAEYRGSGKKFAILEGNYSHFGKLYTLAQCTPDLSTDDCTLCLREAINFIPSCCDGKFGGRVAFQSCNIRFETYKFYTTADNAPPPDNHMAPPPSITSHKAPTPPDVANNSTVPPPSITFTSGKAPTPPDVANNSTAPPPSITFTSGKGKSISVAVVVAIVVSIIVSIILFVLAFLFLNKRSKETYGVVADGTEGNDMSAVESIQYSFSEIQAATNNFSIDHKIGEGGFGHVYKGTFPNGQDIAVKRLSRTSVQGLEEFKNEISLVAKLQHRNLVRLLGFSFQGEEKILIYEFVPNKSLDYFIFNREKQGILDWSRRQKIIAEIAKGLLYLHEDSRLRIIHRDLKASNILLDANMNPKIADFGMARIFEVDQSEGKTHRIAGTYGYMSPEYVMHGQFSVKSDVYSFGVLVLEIISGKKNSNFYQLGLGEDNLLSYAWKNWRKGTPLALLDPVDQHLGDSNYSRNEILLCIQVGLLCVQEDVEQRPTMASVVLMLSSSSITLATPRHPAFFVHRKTEPSWPRIDLEESDKSTTKSVVQASVNKTLITELYPR